MLRVPVDFNTMEWDPDERVWINTLVNGELVRALRPGLHVLLYDSDLEVEATVECEGNQPARKWLARPRWTTMRDLPYDR